MKISDAKKLKKGAKVYVADAPKPGNDAKVRAYKFDGLRKPDFAVMYLIGPGKENFPKVDTELVGLTRREALFAFAHVLSQDIAQKARNLAILGEMYLDVHDQIMRGSKWVVDS